MTRELVFHQRYNKLLDEYMTQPIEQYSIKSFYDNGDCDESFGTATGRRRWLLRRLSKKECFPYQRGPHSRSKSKNNWGMQIKTLKSPENANDAHGSGENTNSNNYFRIAVPLLPLIGLELTPVIDLEVLPAGHNLEANRLSYHMAKNQWIGESFKRAFKGRDTNSDITDEGTTENLQIKSLRVSLLSNEDEVEKYMKVSEPGQLNPLGPAPTPTAVSKDLSVQKMGNEAIGMVGKVDEWLEPHLSFDVSITWDDGIDASRPGEKECEGTNQSSITVVCDAMMSVTIPSLPIALPSGLLVKKIGSIVSKRALLAGMNRFLQQVEQDFKRWANIAELHE